MNEVYKLGYYIGNYDRVTKEEFENYFKTAPKTYPVELRGFEINFGTCYLIGHCTYDTNEILGIFYGANNDEYFSEYYLLKN